MGIKNHFWKCFSFIMISHCSFIERGHSLWTDTWAILLTSLFTYKINCLTDMQKVQTETDLYRRDTNTSTLCVNKPIDYVLIQKWGILKIGWLPFPLYYAFKTNSETQNGVKETNLGFKSLPQEMKVNLSHSCICGKFNFMVIAWYLGRYQWT